MMKWIALLSLLPVLAACGVEGTGVPSGTASCPASTAQIRIGDGYITAVCGCQEGNRTLSASVSTRLDCTVAAGTTVFFSFSGSTLAHQIASTGSPSFTSSPVYLSDVKKPRAPTVHAIRFSASGNYDFQDTYGPGITGRLIVL